jgi:lipopolysaccharide biosynthesis regulator YciM
VNAKSKLFSVVTFPIFIQELEESNKHFGYHTDFENLEKKIIEIQLKDRTDFKNSKKKFLELPQLKHHPEFEHYQKLIEFHIKRLEQEVKARDKNLRKLSEHWVKKREAVALKRLSMLDPAVD